MGEFKAQELANTAWAYATTVWQSAKQQFMVLVDAVQRRVGEFNGQDIANTAWAFATMKQSDGQVFLVFMAFARVVERWVGKITA